MTGPEKIHAASEDARKCVDRAASGYAICVVDDLPVVIPLSVAELDAVESYLGLLLDALLDASPCHVTKASEGAAGGAKLPADGFHSGP